MGQLFLTPRFGLTWPLSESHIVSRAWVIQERFLSPRTLHFTKEQIFWQCAGMYACETFPLGMAAIYDDLLSRHYRASSQALFDAENTKVYKIRGRLCEDYSFAALTYTSDRLIAFAGIVAGFKKRLPNDTYLAGIWKGDLLSGLLWKVRAMEAGLTSRTAPMNCMPIHTSLPLYPANIAPLPGPGWARTAALSGQQRSVESLAILSK